MKYRDPVDVAKKFEEEHELTECIYFGAIEKLKEVQEDTGKMDDVRHIRRVLKLFLINWGMMNRVVGRKDVNWRKLSETLRSLKQELSEVKIKTFLATDFDEEPVSDAIKTIYVRLDPIPYLGSPTTLGKILYLTLRFLSCGTTIL